MSRKTLLAVFAILAAVLGYIGSAFGLTLQPAAAVTGLGAVILYVLFEAKADFARLAAQKDKWKDVKFWTAAIAAGVAALGTAGIDLPISSEIISAVLTGIMAILFKTKTATT